MNSEDIVVLVGQIQDLKERFYNEINIESDIKKLMTLAVELTSSTEFSRWILWRVLEVDPLNFDAHIEMAIGYCLDGDDRRAIEFVKKAKEIDPDNPRVKEWEKSLGIV